MNLLILGAGGREHALAWRLSKDSSTTLVHVWPGNDGISGDKIKTYNGLFNKENFFQFIRDHKIHFVIPGAEKYLYEGVADWCNEIDIPCFGPGQKASELEKSKIFSKKLMEEAGIPTARFEDLTSSFTKDINEAVLKLKTFKKPVIKISGPALGKGVFVCEDFEEASDVLRNLKENPIPGIDEGIMVEEQVSGREVSMFFACHDQDYAYLGSAQDHKRLLDSDKGPNTGGMGAISPVSWVDQNFVSQVVEKILLPTLETMKERKTPFKGILFLGLMVNENEMNLLEYNVRFGDPETQVILPLIEGDLSKFLLEFSKGHKSELCLKNETAVHIVKSARGYPGLFGTHVEKGRPIHFFPNTITQTQFFFAGVKRNGEFLLTDGGRVFGVTSWGTSKQEARITAYEAINSVRFDGEHFRRDIGKNL